MTKNLVFPLPLPPITTTFLFLAYFGCFGRLFICTGSLRPADGSPWQEDAPKAPVQSSEPSAIESLERLAKLYERGLLTEEEFAKKKAEMLAKM